MRKVIMVTFFFLLVYAVKPCFTIVVGREASADGAVILAHNEDESGDPIIKIWWVPSKTGVEGFSLISGAQEVWRGNPDMLWLEMKQKYYADFFINSYGVAVISNRCRSVVERKMGEKGISYFLRRLAIERAKTAREAVLKAGQLIEKYGYPEGRTLTFADPKEGWLMHILGGKHWLAWRVPDDAVALLPNNFTAGIVDLKDRENILHSRGFLSFAIKNGFLKKGQTKFHFTETFSPDYSSSYNTGRWLSAYKVLTGRDFTGTPPFPPFIKLDYKLRPEKLFEVLRQRPAPGTDLSSLFAIRSICYYTTKHSFVLSLWGNQPGDILLWLSPARPEATPYIPIFFEARKIFPSWNGSHREILPEHFLLKGKVREEVPHMLYYPFRTHADEVYLSSKNPLLFWKEYEKNYLRMAYQVRERAKALMKEGKMKEAREILINFSAGAIERARAQLR